MNLHIWKVVELSNPVDISSIKRAFAGPANISPAPRHNKTVRLVMYNYKCLYTSNETEIIPQIIGKALGSAIRMARILQFGTSYSLYKQQERGLDTSM